MAVDRMGVIGGGTAARLLRRDSHRPLAGTSFDDEGYSQFDVEETPIETADGSYEVSLSVSLCEALKSVEECAGDSADESGSAGFARRGDAKGRQKLLLRNQRDRVTMARRARCLSSRGQRACGEELTTMR